MASIDLALNVACLDCPMIDVDDHIDVFYDAASGPYMVVGSITCAHAGVCKHYDPETTIGKMLDGEAVGS